MSRENVAIVRELLEGFARRDHERAFDFYDPEIEWDATGLDERLPDLAGVYHGHDGVRTYWRRWLSAWSDLDYDVDDVIDAGDDVVAMIGNQRQWGRSSGIVTEFPPYAIVFSFRNGLVVRWRSYPDREAALRAVGLGD
jgi:ketosteroid isomerase-like protein